MEYNCEWLKHHINDIDPPTFPCEWAKRNWHKTISQITEPFPCDNLREKWEGKDSYRTVLYTDGTFIINEKSTDIDANVQTHGEAVNEYPPLDAEHDYVFNNSVECYWYNERYLIKYFEVGSNIKPISMRAWCYGCKELETFNSLNIDTSECTSMQGLFAGMYAEAKTKLTSLDLSNFDTSNVTSMRIMFQNCSALTSLDLSTFDTSDVTDMNAMFHHCRNLQTIYVSNLFDVTNVSSSNFMFNDCTSIVGGAGTTYDNNKTDKEYARIDNPPDAPGYFTEK